MFKKTIPIEKAVQIASEMHRAGQYERAEAMYREILAQDPGNVDAMYLLGALANQGGRPDIGVQLIGRALSRRPDAALIQFHYADALANNGEWEKAAEHFEKAIALEPEYVDAMTGLCRVYTELKRFEEAVKMGASALLIENRHAVAHNNVGNAMRGLGREADAARHYQAAVEANPSFAEAFNNLGLSLVALGFVKDGEEKLREAARLAPTLAEVHNNLGVTLANQGRFEEAIKEFETTTKLDEDHAEAHNNIGGIFRTMGRYRESLEEIEKAIELKPKVMKFHLNYAQTLKDAGRVSEAVAAIDKYLEAEPKSVFATFFKGSLQRESGDPDAGIETFRKALEIEPNSIQVLSTLGYALQERGELDEALEALNRSIAAQADSQTHSNVMMVMCYHPHVTPERHFEAHRAFAKVHEDPIKPHWKPHGNSRDPERRLRVGYLSPDIRGHVVSYFTNPIYENHDHGQVEVFAYSMSPAADATTITQRATFDHWRETVGKGPDLVAEMIRKDEIDILVELAGHTANNGLPVLARKPAPIQMNAIGFPSTTGLTAVDYRLTDRLCDPPGYAERFNSETLLYLPDCFWCYEPPALSPEVGELPVKKNGHVRFVSVNNFTKVTPQVLGRWAEIVAEVKGSRILLQTSGLASAFVRERVKRIFAERGVSDDRIEMKTTVPFYQYLQVIEGCDIMLDPFPFNGGTTSCHSLWMGVPVVSLAGKMHAGRMGLSMLNCIGLPELCGADEGEYVKIAVELASDVERLAGIRAGMRERLKGSPLLDGKRYTRNLEGAYRRVWREWCGG